jgi:hypothetical protein
MEETVSLLHHVALQTGGVGLPAGGAAPRLSKALKRRRPPMATFRETLGR